GLRRPPCHVSVEGLRARRAAPHDDAVRDGVFAALRPTHSAARLRPDPAIGVSREHLSRRSRGARAHAPRPRAHGRSDVSCGDQYPHRCNVGVSSLWRRDDLRPDPLRAPAQDDHLRLGYLMTPDPRRDTSDNASDYSGLIGEGLCLGQLRGVGLDLPNRLPDVIDVRRFGEQQVLRHRDDCAAHLAVTLQFLKAVAVLLEAPGTEEPLEAARGNGFVQETVEILLLVTGQTGDTFGPHRLDELLAE